MVGSDAVQRNVELKAIDPDPRRSLGACQALGAEDHGHLQQRDIYFNVRAGRLKLRESSPGGAELIQYERADEPHQRLSSYRIVPIVDPAGLHQALETALGVRAIVVKRRHLLTWQCVRIHLDAVEDLGSFIELEAVASPDSDLSFEHAQIVHLRDALDIVDERLCARGYADQLGV